MSWGERVEVIDTVHIAVCMKPIEGNFAQNSLQHGVAGLNVDACRVETENDVNLCRNNQVGDNGWKNSSGGRNSAALRQDMGLEALGRWPANVIHDGSDEVKAEFPYTKSGDFSQRGQSSNTVQPGGWRTAGRNDKDFKGDEGSAARFFKECPQDDD